MDNQSHTKGWLQRIGAIAGILGLLVGILTLMVKTPNPSLTPSRQRDATLSATKKGSPMPQSPLSIQISWSNTYPGYIVMMLSGLAPGPYSFTCKYGNGGSTSSILNVTTDPQSVDNGDTCYDKQPGDMLWVTIDAVGSNVLTVAPAASPSPTIPLPTATPVSPSIATPVPLPPTPTPVPPPPPTSVPQAQGVPETAGGRAHTWSNYMNAGGSPGPLVAANQTIVMSCKLMGFKVLDGNPWWYRIASPPWNNAYYGSADNYYNNGQTSGSLIGTPWVDPNVPDC